MGWNIFNPKKEQFKSEKQYEEYREHCRCALCHEKLEIGDEFDLRPVQTPEQAGGLTVQAVIVHRKCLDEEDNSPPKPFFS